MHIQQHEANHHLPPLGGTMQNTMSVAVPLKSGGSIDKQQSLL
jgi:hypothetical protein